MSLRLYTPGIGETVLPWIPRSITVSDVNDTFTTQERPGSAPVLYKTGKGLKKQRLSVTISRTDEGSVESTLAALEAHATSDEQTRVLMASQTRINSHVTRLEWDEVDWDITGACIRAVADIEFTTASDAAVSIGPVKGGSGPAKKPKKPGKKPKPVKKPPKKKK